MKKIILAFLSLFFFLPFPAKGQSKLVKRLKAGQEQTLVVYGTSLSTAENALVWVREISRVLNEKYGNHLRVFSSGKSGMWSTWAVQHLDDSVLSKHPDAVMIEFGINDAFLDFHTSPEVARINLHYLIDRIRLANPDCEIILQIMNVPIRSSRQKRPQLEKYYAVYRQVARKRKALLIDHAPYWERILQQGEEEYLKYVPDNIHPSKESSLTLTAPFILKRLGA
jgi:acyl-CoA thioesterase I